MLFRILGEALVGLMAAGMVVAIVVPTVASLGYEPKPWLAWVAVVASVAVAVIVGERMNKRRMTRESP